MTWTCRTCQQQVPPRWVMGQLAADAGGAIHAGAAMCAAGSPVPIICGPVMLVLHARTIAELSAAWMVLVRTFTTLPAPVSTAEAIALVNRSMADAFASLQAVPPTSSEDRKIETDLAFGKGGGA